MSVIKLDMGNAWNDAVAMLKAHWGLLLPIAGVFIFLPAFALGALFPQPEPAANATPQQLFEGLFAYFKSLAPFLLVTSVLATLGNIAMSKILVGPDGGSVGDAIKLGLTLLIGVFLATWLSQMAIGLGILLLIIPGLYLFSRLSLIIPIAAASQTGNPISLIKASWDLTRENVWSILGFLILIVIVLGIASVIIAGITGGILALVLPATIANLLANFIDAATQAILGIVMMAVAVAIYKQLTDDSAARVFA
jgi:hypothetical protein